MSQLAPRAETHWWVGGIWDYPISTDTGCSNREPGRSMWRRLKSNFLCICSLRVSKYFRLRGCQLSVKLTHTGSVVSVCLISDPDVRGIYKAGKHGQKKLINRGERATSVSWKNTKYRLDKSAFRNDSLQILMSSVYVTVANCPEERNRENVTSADNRLDS